MTLEIDPERVVAAANRIDRDRGAVVLVAEHLVRVGVRTDLSIEVAPAVATAARVIEHLTVATALLRRCADDAGAADRFDVAPDRPASFDQRRSFAGGSALCSAIQLVSPIPARPSTSGVTGAIDTAGVARDAAALVDTAASGVSVAGRAVPLTSLGAAAADTALCRLRVGSGAPISTRKTVDDDGREIYEGSRSRQPFMDRSGLPLDSDLEHRDRDMWRAEHRNEPYPGYPAFEVNAPRR